MTADEIRQHAEEIILDHARDVEFLTIAEHLADRDIDDPDDDTARAIDDMIRKATVTVEFPESGIAAEPATRPAVVDAAGLADPGAGSPIPQGGTDGPSGPQPTGQEGAR